MNKLSELSPEIGLLSNLTKLMLHDNKLSALPPEIGQLSNLTVLNLADNQLIALPPEIGQLINLSSLNLDGNQLRALPSEIGLLTNLKELDVDDNPLNLPPPEIIEQGKQAIFTYLKGQLHEKRHRWISKLLIVGEGGVGKTAMLRSLRDQPFDSQLSTTRGIQIEMLEIEHPEMADVTMQLNAWDFGGQEIYHATHQFFLTNRSLFLLVWNSRHGYEQGKIYYWLDAIQARAPESPVIIVATHLDQRDADIPLIALRKKYPQIIGQYEISNLTGEGVEELKKALSDTSAQLPLMGEYWPAKWIDAWKDILDRYERYITPNKFFEITNRNGLTNDEAIVLSQWMHELGDILYFLKDEELNDIVILKPQWVTKYISKVLESDEVIGRLGIFTRAHMDELWSDLSRTMQDHFLRLMERFDLSYRTLENKEISLVVERLPLDPPNYYSKWEEIRNNIPCQEIAMKFQLNTIPAGIPTWFIARSHRFTTHTHWRLGALFAYERTIDNNKHLALIQTHPHERNVILTVRGPIPYNFFSLLKDGFELTLNRFPGLKVERTIPCPGHNGDPCPHEFNYEQLLKRIERKSPRFHIECPEALEDVDVRTLLFGLSPVTIDSVLHEVKKAEVRDQERHKELVTLLQREFIKNYRREQAIIDSHCPNVFVLRPRDASSWSKLMIGQKVELQLYCQAPGNWHPTLEGGKYVIDRPVEWLRQAGPYIQRMVTMLKYVTPIIIPGIGMIAADYAKLIEYDLKFMNELVEIMPEIIELDELKLAEEIGDIHEPDKIHGAPLRTLRMLLDEKDPYQNWGGLRKVFTPEGHYLWLCEYHAQEYII